MKLYSKLSAGIFGVVLSTAIASASTYQIGSYATGQPNMGNANTAMSFDHANPVNPDAVGTGTVAIDPGLWHSALPNSTWISFGQTGPTTPFASQPGGHFAPDGDYFFTTTFTLDGNATAFTFSVLADDTTAVFLDGVGGGNALVGAATGGNIICQNNTPNCLNVATVTEADVPGALALLTAGTHTLTFQVSQLQGLDLGLDFSSTIETVVPEPSSLLLLGTGLVGSAGALARRRLKWGSR